MLNIATTASRAYGMIADPQATLANNSHPVPHWAIVAREHVLPVILVSAAVHVVLSLALRPLHEVIFRSAGLEMPESGNLALDFGVRIGMQFAGILAWSAILGFFAGTLGGRNEFNAAYVLVALALTPYVVGTAMLSVPVLGLLFWLAGFVRAIVTLYQGAPALLGVPNENRAKVLVLSLVSMLLAGMAVASIFGPLVARPVGVAG